MHAGVPLALRPSVAVFAAVTVIASTLAALAQTIAGGTLVSTSTVTQQLKYSSAGSCLGTANAGVTAGTRVGLVACTNAATARWALHESGHVRLERDLTKCLVAKDASSVELGACADLPTAKWKLLDSGLLRSLSSGGCLSRKGAAELHLLPCSEEPKWALVDRRVVAPLQPPSNPSASPSTSAASSTPGRSTLVFEVQSGLRIEEGIFASATAMPDQFVGTMGQGVGLSWLAVKPITTGPRAWPACLKLQYMLHVSGTGDTGWYDAPKKAQGTIEGVAFKVGGSCATDHTVEYRCHIAGQGTTNLLHDGAFCGTRGQGRSVEAIALTVRTKTTQNAPAAPSKPGVSTVSFDVSGHVEKRGDVSSSPDSWIGTRGKGLRLEAFAVKPIKPAQGTWPTCLKLQYMAHLAGTGDTGWYDAPALAGTKGQHRSIEGVAFKASGSCGADYVVEYSCHVKDVGDLPRVSNGQLCGTRGQGRQLEAIKLTVRKK